MADNFNPGFDREKKAFIDLANRGEGLSPINYLYAGDASFESVLASYVKGGTFDINFLFVNTVEAEKISTFYLNAEVAYVTLAYVKDLHINNIYVDKFIADIAIVDKELIVGRKDHQRATAKFYTTNFTVDNSEKFSVTSDITEFSTKLFAITGEYFVDSLITITVGSIDIAAAVNISTVAPVISFDALGSFSINYFSSLIPGGLVSIYSGSSIKMSAPTMDIGLLNAGWASAIEVFINSLTKILLSSGQISIATTKGIDFTISDDFKVHVVGNFKADIFKDMNIYVSDKINIEADVIDIALTDSFSMSATKEVTISTEDFLLTGYKKIELKTNVIDGTVNIECNKADFTAEDNMSLKGMEKLNLFSKKKLSLVGHELVYLSSIDKISLTVGESLISLTSHNPGNDTVKIEAQNFLLDFQSAEITGNVLEFEISDKINIDCDTVNITGFLAVYEVNIDKNLNVGDSITFNNITFKSNGFGTYTWPSSNTVPAPSPIFGTAVLASAPPAVTGTINFTIPNVLTLVNGYISKVNYNVTVTCV